ncbi:MAG: Do family serine endopeptidase [Rickettsiales bacterium]
MHKNILLTKFFAIIALLVTSFLSSQAYAKTPPAGFADIVEPLLPAVVNISTTKKKLKSYRNNPTKPFPEGSPFEEFNQFFERFADPRRDQDEENQKKHFYLGSGFIIDKKGYIVTNNHVIAEADEITVTLSSGKQLKAKVIGGDKKTDLALLKVNHKNPLPFVKFGDSDKSRIGDWIIAIGNPFGLGGSVTAGIISAHERDIHPDGLVDNFIQTDAAINRGNSGGPMFNMLGEVIGINTAILSPSGVYIGIGFATPSSVANVVIKQLLESGKITRGMLGVKIQQLSEDLAEPLGLKADQGVLVVEIVKDGAADKSGIKVGDIITQFENNKIDNVRKLSRLVAESPLKKPLVIKLIRNNKKIEKSVTLNQDTSDTKKESDAVISGQEIMKARLQALDSRLRGKYSVPSQLNGLVITSVSTKSSWYKKGFAEGDVIISANQTQLKSVGQLKMIISKAKLSKKKSLLLLVYRKGHTIFVPLDIK